MVSTIAILLLFVVWYLLGCGDGQERKA